MSRFENRISGSDSSRIANDLADVFVALYKKLPKVIVLDIDDMEDTVYGSRQLSSFNTYFDGSCYQSLHVYVG